MDSSNDKPEEDLKVVEGELSEIDLGNKDLDFDELIIFTHTYLNYRKSECITTEIEPFSLLLTNNEFLMAGTASIDQTAFSSMNNKEIVQSVTKRALDYNTYEAAQKFNFVDSIPDYADQIGFDSTVDLLIPILMKVSNEREVVIEKFLKIFAKFIEFLALHKEEGYKMIRDIMIPILNEIIEKKKNEEKIMGLCSDALLHVVKFIRDEDKGPHILKIVIMLAHFDDEKDKDKSKTIAAQLQNDLAPFIGKESCEMWIVPQVGSFAEDHIGGVRKAVLKNFMKICETVSPECFKSRLLPIYEKLAKDSLWNVRKPAVEILPNLTKLCDSHTISSTLLPLYKVFSSDSKNYVKFSAIEIFGQFITLLNKQDRSDDLLEYYISIVLDINSKDKEDLNIAIHCAYNFPAVLLAYGRDKWDKIKPCFDKFVSESNEKIRGPIASSIGEISKIVGAELTERDLLVSVEKFYKDTKLQGRIINALPEIAKNISPKQKMVYLDYLKVMKSSNEKWRKRMEYSKIIGQFNEVYNDEMLYKHVFSIGVAFCFDDVAKVRFKASKCISKMLLQLLLSNEEYKNKTLMILKAFAQSINYHYRQLFIRMCNDLYSNEELFNKDIIDYIYDLAYDEVANVRMTLAKCLGRLLKENSKYLNTNVTINTIEYAWIKDNEKMIEVITKLKKDNLKIVFDYVKGLEIKEVEVKSYCSNDKFNNTMKIISDEFGIMKNLPIESKVKTMGSINISNSNSNSNSDNSKMVNTDNKISNVKETIPKKEDTVTLEDSVIKNSNEGITNSNDSNGTDNTQ